MTSALDDNVDVAGAADALAPLEREAHAWIRRLTSGDATLDDVEDFERWQSRSAAHATAFAAASRLWQAFGPAGRQLRAQGGAAPLSRQSISRRMVVGGALAASAAGVMVKWPPLQLWPTVSELMADYRTATGEQRRITIGNGASVRLNTQTSIAVAPSQDGAESLALIAGEAAIEVPQSAPRPLAVLAAEGRVSAGAAQFDIRLAGGIARVTCFAGEIDVAHRDHRVRLAPLQQVSYGGGVLGASTSIDPGLASAWHSGFLVFRSTPLADVIDELNRYRPGRVVLLDGRLRSLPVNGRFRTDRIDAVLAQIQQAFGTRMTALPGGIVLLG